MDRKIEGYSMVEISVIIVILSILMVLTVSAYMKFKANRELTRQANQIVDEISWIKSQSIAKEPHGIVVDLNSYTIFRDLDGDCSYSAGDQIVRSINFVEEISADSAKTFVFDRKGYPRSSNCALGVAEGNITLKNTNNNKKIIKVSRYGRTTIE